MGDRRGHRHRADHGSAHEVVDGQITDVALDDASQTHVVLIVLASVANLAALFLNVAAWRARD